MLANFFQALIDVPETRFRMIRMTGVGAGAPTKNIGHGVTITRQGAGDYKLTFNEYTGSYVGADYSLESATMTDLKNFSVVFKNYDTTNRVIEFTLFNASGTATDLQANQQIIIYAQFAMINSALM